MKTILFPLITAAALLTGSVRAQNEYAEIARLRGLNESVRGIRSMADGEHYTTLESNDIVRYSYASAAPADGRFRRIRFGRGRCPSGAPLRLLAGKGWFS